MTQGESGSLEIIFPADRAVAERSTPRRDQVLNAWLLSKRSANTRSAYRNDVTQFFGWFDTYRDQLGVEDVFGLQRIHLDGYRTYLSETYSPASVARRLAAVSNFYAYAGSEHGLVGASPMARVQRPQVSDESSTPSLELDDARRLLAAARDAGPMEHALIGLLVTVGLRISEVINANTGDFSRERGMCVITVTRKGGKRAKLPVPAEVGAAIKAYLGGRRGALFVGVRDGQRLKRQHADRILTRVANTAGVPKVSPHGLRHTAATVALDGGQSIRAVQAMLGHADPKTTMRYDRARVSLDDSAVHAVAELLTTT